MTVAVAGAALSLLLGSVAAVPVAGLATLVRRGVFGRVGWLRYAVALLAGSGVAWFLSEPFRRRLVLVYALFCVGTGIAFVLAAWLARKPAIPEVIAASILGLVGVALMLAIPVDSYDELQDLGFVLGLVGCLAATAAAVGRLAKARAVPLLWGAAMLVAIIALLLLDSISPQWRAAIWVQQRGAARVARVVRAIVDLDRDGYSSILQGGDCNDLDASVHPLASERDGGGDDNCNGVELPPNTPTTRGLAALTGHPALTRDAVDRVLLITVDCWRADALDQRLMPKVSSFASGGMVFEKLYSGGASTLESLPLVVGVGPRGPWVGKIAARDGIRVDAVIAGPVPVALWGFPRVRTVPERAEATTGAALEIINAGMPGRHLLWVHYFDLHALHQFRGESSIPEEPAHLSPSYRVAVRHVDSAIGDLLDELDRRGQLARTVVVMTGDHGEGLGAHGVPNHVQSGFEEILRVPGILRGPGIPAARVPHVVSHRDIPATLLGSLGLSADAIAAEYFGRSWLRQRIAPMLPLHTFVIARSARRNSGRLSSARLGVLVNERHKLIAGLEDGLFELYDLVHDPHETMNLADIEGHLRKHMWRQLAMAWDLDYSPSTETESR